MDNKANMMEMPAFSVSEPEKQTAPFVLNSPHSGRHYPAEFLESSRLSSHRIRSSEDFFVEELFTTNKQLGIPLLSANFPRAYLDLNREPFELDQTMFSDQLPAFVNTRSIRVSSGLGTIAKIVAEGEEIYNRKLTSKEAIQRVERLYKPYHGTLRNMLARTHVTFGCAVLLDCHSMPSNNAVKSNETRPDFVLGDRFGSSCGSVLTHTARAILKDLGYHVELNKPYAGGFITEHYGRPENGLHALQLEINRGLYVNEVSLKPSDGFAALAEDLAYFLDQLIQIDRSDLFGSTPLAAE